ncbi:MAG: homoserine dehydrogenase [Ferruginibacter sp.]|jgi:homoserine dehydrogenase|uniref:homoserine dehydrogenase n=1 Tax=Ferruginibacter sp. TaxID=1940288 RepID=UPI0026586F25|nr:homoserine dehydrogenase [Ferruginibacter sp.]MDB5278477.1 homoserine dehydrogenase [Ferruginibacter sp.]
MSTNKLCIGLFGFGVVGKGLHDVLHSTPTLQASIKKICIKNNSKPRSIASENFTTDANVLLDDENINVIVELIDDADAAYLIVKKALENGKAVVSANKKMIAEHFEELYALQQKYNTPFLYEAACCASMPIIRNLEEYYDNDLLQSFRGIINGSTNFILTKIFQEQVEFNEALLLAKQLGFAESNPTLDIGGFDAANKLSILLAHSFGIIAKTDRFIFNGITNISLQDATVAKEKKYSIKLVANAQKLADGKLAAFVLPQFVTEADDLYHVHNEFNAITTESSFADKHFFKGKGAGAFPTASAVLSDISALRYDYKYEYKKIAHQTDTVLSNDYYLKVFVSVDNIEKLNKKDFEWIEEWHNEFNYSWLIGVVHAANLFKSDWWKKAGISLIACPDAVIENIDYKKISKRSLELAGVV